MSQKLPLTTANGYIIDQMGNRLRLQSVNWYGASDADNIVMGLDINSVSNIAALIKSIGFNSVRLPFSNQMLHQPDPVATDRLTGNPYLSGKSPLEVFDTVVEALAEEGLLVILNNHTTTSTWCCSYDNNALWFSPGQTEAKWISDWACLIQRYHHIPQVVGADLRNEVRAGPIGQANWGKGDDFDWPRAAEAAGNHLLSLNSDLLIVVEGVNYAADLRQVTTRPIHLSRPEQLIYSPHVYSWFQGIDGRSLGGHSYEELCQALDVAWGYLGPIQKGDGSRNLPTGADQPFPLWISEMGVGPMDQPAFLENLCRYIQERDLSWAWWPLNTGLKPDSEEMETWGLVNEKWDQPLDDWRLPVIQQLMH